MRPIQENDVFHAIAHPARRGILLTLKEGKRAASELAQPFHMTFAAISQHLRVLEEAELVKVRRHGRHRLYQLHPRPLQDVVSRIDEFAAFFGQATCSASTSTESRVTVARLSAKLAPKVSFA